MIALRPVKYWIQCEMTTPIRFALHHTYINRISCFCILHSRDRIVLCIVHARPLGPFGAMVATRRPHTVITLMQSCAAAARLHARTYRPARTEAQMTHADIVICYARKSPRGAHECVCVCVPCMPIINGSRVSNIISVIRRVIKRNGPVRIGSRTGWRACASVRGWAVWAADVCVRVILIRPQRTDEWAVCGSSGWPLHETNEV